MLSHSTFPQGLGTRPKAPTLRLPSTAGERCLISKRRLQNECILITRRLQFLQRAGLNGRHNARRHKVPGASAPFFHTKGNIYILMYYNSITDGRESDYKASRLHSQVA